MPPQPTPPNILRDPSAPVKDAGLIRAGLRLLVPRRFHPAVPRPVLLTGASGQSDVTLSNLRALYPNLTCIPAVPPGRPEVLARETASAGWQLNPQWFPPDPEFARALSIHRALRLQVNDRIRLMVLMEEGQLPLPDLHRAIRRGGFLLALLPWLNSVRLLPNDILLSTRTSAARILQRLKQAQRSTGEDTWRQAMAPQATLRIRGVR